MRMFLLILVALLISTMSSFVLYKYYKINVPPSVGGLFLVFVWMMLPSKWTDKINKKDSDNEQ